MRGAPPEVIATWPTPNYVDPVRRGPGLVVVELVITALATATVAARLYVRGRIVRSLGIDDWVMIVALVFGIALTTCVILATQRYGWDIHVWDLTMSQAVQGRQVSIAAQTLLVIASGLVKISILLSYLRIAPLDSWFRRITHFSIGLVAILIPVFVAVLWTECTPAGNYWKLQGEKHCEDEGPPVVAQSTMNVLTDALVVVLPLPTLYRLSLPVHQRIVLLVLFSLGFVVVAAGCLRFYWVHHVVDETYDITWEGYDMWLWIAVEVNLGIICGCVPTLKPLLRLVRGKDFSSHHTSQPGDVPLEGNSGTLKASYRQGWSEVGSINSHTNEAEFGHV